MSTPTKRITSFGKAEMHWWRYVRRNCALLMRLWCGTARGAAQGVTPGGGRGKEEALMQAWAIVDDDREAHWVKLRAAHYLTVACGKVLPRSSSHLVATYKVALAQAPGRYYELPESEPACTVCERLAKAQA